MEAAATNGQSEREQLPSSTTSAHQQSSLDSTMQPTDDKSCTSAQPERGSSSVQMDVDEPVVEQGGGEKTEATAQDQAAAVESVSVKPETLAEPVITSLAETLQALQPPPSISAQPAPLMPQRSTTPATEPEKLQAEGPTTSAGQRQAAPLMTWSTSSKAPKASAEQIDQKPESDVLTKDREDHAISDRDTTSAQASPAASSSPVLPRPSSSLPTLDSSWPSKGAFISGCRRGLKESFGAKLWIHSSDENYASVQCSKKLSRSCGWTVAAKRQEDGRWIVKRTATVLEHSHQPEPLGEEQESAREGDEAPSRLETEPQPQRRATPTLVINDTDDEDEPVEPASFHSTADVAEWTLTTRCQALRQLVAKRDAIFTRQRTFAIDDLQAQSLQLAQQYLSSFRPSTAHLSPFGNVLRIYYQFCADLHLPSSPITPSIVTLCVWWLTIKAPTVDFYPFVVFLNGVKKATSEVWEEKLSEEDKGGSLMRFKPLEEFLIERGAKGYTTCSPAITSAPTQPAPAKPQQTSSTTKDRNPSSSQPSAKTTSKAPVIPNAPRVGDRFADAAAAMEHVRVHVVPVLGVGVSTPSYSSASTTSKLRCNHDKNTQKRCEYQIVLAEDKATGDWVVHESSTLRHNHGPRVQILADPNWRPPTLPNRVSLGRQRDRRRASSSSTLASNSDDDEDGSDEDESDEASRTSRPSSRTRATAKRSSPAPNTAVSTKKHKTSSPTYPTPYITPAQPQLYRPAPALFTRSSASYYALPSPAPTSSRDQTPSFHRAGSTVYAPSSEFLPTLTTFLTSLHPSFGAAASTLYQVGVKDLALLVQFLAMEETSMDKLLKEVNMNLLQKHLLKKEWKAAKESGWGVGSAREG